MEFIEPGDLELIADTIKDVSEVLAEREIEGVIAWAPEGRSPPSGTLGHGRASRAGRRTVSRSSRLASQGDRTARAGAGSP
jgi:hypothetical protein